MFSPPYTLKDVFAQAKRRLEKIYDIREAGSVAGILFDDSIPQFSGRLITEPGLIIPDNILETLESRIKELMKNRPLQYVLGKTEFYGLEFKVDESVLIPRPETEELVDHIIRTNRAATNILDIGTGSGCIAITLALNLSNSRVTATDISDEALSIAKENALKNSAKVHFVKDDILHPIGKYDKFDLIVSNPPYVLEKEKQLMHWNVLDFEPHLALFVRDDDPLIFYRAIVQFALGHLREGGKLYFEINEKYGMQVKNLLEKSNLKKVEILRDLAGRDRMVSASL